jgi:hypothetical protein
MKKNIIALLPVLLVLFALTACKKNVQKIIDYTVSSDAALTKVVNAMPYLRGPIQVKINDVRVSNNITYATPFPGGGLNTPGNSFPDYLALSAGSNKVSFSIANVGTNNDSIALFNGPATLESSKYQTAYATDTGANTQIVVVPDDISAPDSGYSRFRFINLIPNLPAADLYWGTTVIASNIAYKSISASFVMPIPIANVTLAIRPAGAASSTAALGSYVVTSIGNQRVLTIFSRGYTGVTTTDVRRPMVSLLFNR